MPSQTLLIIILLASASSAPTPRSLGPMVTGETTGLDVPQGLTTGIGIGSGTIQLVVNIHTDGQGNIEVYTN